MSIKKVITFVIVFLLAPGAGKAQFLSTVKQGDWFVIRYEKDIRKVSFDRHYFKFELQEIRPDGRRLFEVSVKRTVSMIHYKGEIKLGIDSYYPPFSNVTSDEIPGPTYTVLVSTDSQKDSLWRSGSGNLTIKFHELGFPMVRNKYAVESERDITEELSGIVKWLNMTGKLPRKLSRDLGQGYESIRLIQASPTDTANIIITGDAKHGQDAKDSKFKLSLKKEEPGVIDVQFGSKHIPLFVDAGDSIHITLADTTSASEPFITGSAQLENEYFLKMRLAMEAGEQSWKRVSVHNLPTFLNNEIQTQKRLEAILSVAKPQLPAYLYNYFSGEAYFYKMYHRMAFYSDVYNGYNKAVSADAVPATFTSSPDTATIFKNLFFKGGYYEKCADLWFDYKKMRLNVYSHITDFYKDYYLAISLLKEYPLYKQLALLLREQIRSNNWTDNQRVQPLYTDFLNNCADPQLRKEVMDIWSATELFKPGNPSLFQVLELTNGKKVQLDAYKGKPLVIVFRRNIIKLDFPVNRRLGYGWFEKLGDQVPILIADLIPEHHSHIPRVSGLDTGIFHLPNVTYFSIRPNAQAGIMDWTQQSTSVLILDKWHRVVDMLYNAGLHDTLVPAKVKQALTAEHYSPQQKAERRNLLLWTTSAILLTSIIFGIFYLIRTRNLKKRHALERKMQDMEIKALRSQMNPHFVFNALNSIQSLIIDQRYEDAHAYLAEFGILLRNILQHADKELISLADELETIEHYCHLEQLRFNFTFEISIASGIHPAQIEIPGMLIQPLVENAVVHGFQERETGATLCIEITKDRHILTISVRDNGKGIRGAPGTSKKYKGMGIHLLKERLRNFNDHQLPNSLVLKKPENQSGLEASFKLWIDE